MTDPIPNEELEQYARLSDGWKLSEVATELLAARKQVAELKSIIISTLESIGETNDKLAEARKRIAELDMDVASARHAMNLARVDRDAAFAKLKRWEEGWASEHARANPLDRSGADSPIVILDRLRERVEG